MKKNNDLLDEREEEIERLKGIIEEQERLYQDVLDNNEEIKIKSRRLNNIINKAIEYIKKFSNNGMFELEMEEIEELLDILKGSDKE